MGGKEGSLLPLSWLRLDVELRRRLAREFYGELIATIANAYPGGRLCVRFRDQAEAEEAAGYAGIHSEGGVVDVPLAEAARWAVLEPQAEEFWAYDSNGVQVLCVGELSSAATVLIDESTAHSLRGRTQRFVSEVARRRPGTSVGRAIAVRASYFVAAAFCLAAGYVVGELATDHGVRYAIGLAVTLACVAASVPVARYIERHW